MSLTHLSDEQLVSQLLALGADGRRLDARTIAFLVEVEDRRIHLKSAHSSMFDFCRRRMRLSEGAAFRRLNAARLVRRFPSLLGRVENGDVDISMLVVLRDHLTAENVDELVEATKHMTKRQAEELLARRAPRPDVPATLRKLPSPNATPTPTPTPTPTAALLSPPLPVESPVSLPAPPPVVPRPLPPPRLEPLAEARYKLQLTADQALVDDIDAVRDLMRHQNPSGDLVAIVREAMRLLRAKLEKQRMAKTERPRKQAKAPAPTTQAIPRAVRREVFERDGAQCTFHDDDGNRCPARGLLELDHVDARARGGPNDPANLRVRCRPHNQLHAEQTFGREHVARSIYLRRRKSKAAREAEARATDVTSREEPT